MTGFKSGGSLATGRLLSNLLGDFRTRQDRPVARRLGVPLRPTACRRARPTPPQSGLDQREHRRNPRGAFEFAGPIRADHWVILDGVVTTGSTVGKLARLLKRAGARRVDVWALARRP
jgi:predicted amidophosphoribosyltransferase